MSSSGIVYISDGCIVRSTYTAAPKNAGQQPKPMIRSVSLQTTQKMISIIRGRHLDYAGPNASPLIEGRNHRAGDRASLDLSIGFVDLRELNLFCDEIIQIEATLQVKLREHRDIVLDIT
jgi:hypothetical protein